MTKLSDGMKKVAKLETFLLEVSFGLGIAAEILFASKRLK
ncbi:MAG: hypothetical protein JWO06_735 [Bacteroidota bacterium]|nr:hypothetical protein [Bacteroidota bacterium]